MRRDKNAFRAIGQNHVEQFIAFVDIDGDDAVRSNVLKIGQRGLLDHTFARDHQNVTAFRKFLHGHDTGEFPVRRNLNQVDDGFAARRRRRIRHFVHLHLVDQAIVGEDHEICVRRGDKQMLDKIFVLGHRAKATLAATALARVSRYRSPFDIPALSDGDRDVFVGDQIFDRVFSS